MHTHYLNQWTVTNFNMYGDVQVAFLSSDVAHHCFSVGDQYLPIGKIGTFNYP